MGELLAAFVLSGGRRGEVFGLEVGDIDFLHKAVHIRPNAWRGLKKPGAPSLGAAVAPAARVAEAVSQTNRTAEGLVFPAPSGGMLRDIRDSLTTAVREAGIQKAVTPHTFRHTYAAARIQTTDHGAPVSPYTVMREFGHSSLTLVEQTYGHTSWASGTGSASSSIGRPKCCRSERIVGNWV